MKQPQKAIPCFEKAVLADPTNMMNWLWLNLGLKENSDYQKQLYWLQKKQAYFPEDSTISAEIGYCYIELKDFAKALQFLKLPNNPGPYDYYNLACLYAALGKPEEALKNLELAFQNGYKDFDDMAKDKYLAPVRDTPAYIALIKKYKKN